MPRASQWGEADVPGLTHYVNLAVVPDVWLDSKSLAELRNLADRYGLNPYSRRVRAAGSRHPGTRVRAARPGRRLGDFLSSVVVGVLFTLASPAWGLVYAAALSAAATGVLIGERPERTP